jgi:hypothetical protein
MRSSNVDLSATLETLQPLLLSQHEAYSSLIVDLGTLTLNSTKIINDVTNTIKRISKGIIPNNLRIQCRIPTEQKYSNHPSFLARNDEVLQLREKFCKEASDCITQEFNYNNSKQREFVGEILIPFDSILKSTSIDLWNAKTLQDNLKLASEKLKARVEASKTLKATELTTEAFAKASEAAVTAANEHATVNIHLNNLERANRINKTKTTREDDRGYTPPKTTRKLPQHQQPQQLKLQHH